LRVGLGQGREAALAHREQHRLDGDRRRRAIGADLTISTIDGDRIIEQRALPLQLLALDLDDADPAAASCVIFRGSIPPARRRPTVR
jgi:hypothetical protein